VCQPLAEVLSPEKVYVGSYGDGVRHIHFLVTPRMADMPASNVHLTITTLLLRLLYRIGYKNLAFPESEAVEIAGRVKGAITAQSSLRI
jgi:hypothetical protein